MKLPLALMMSALSLSACATSVPSSGASVTGEASYRERIAVPPGARFEVVLEDASLADARSVRIAESVIDDAGQPLYRFSIAYDPKRIIASHTYTVRTTLRHDGRLLFTSVTHTPVITRGNPGDVRIVMKSLAAPSNTNTGD